MENLPTEIIREVCGSFCLHCTEPPDPRFLFMHPGVRERQALAKLCLTSSKLRAIAQPLLYHRIFISERQKSLSIPLLNTLISRPDLAQAVRHLTITDMCTERNIIDDAVLSRLTLAARQRGLPLSDDWIEDHDLQPHSLMQQLLLQVPHVELVAFLSLSYQIWDLLGSVDSATRSLPTLRKVVLDCYDTEMGYDLSIVTSLFSLAPNLNKLSLFQCCSVSNTLSLRNVTCLALEASWISADDMSRLLSSCGKLDTFVYDGSADMISDGAPRVSANGLVRMLEEQGHSRTLRRLSLNFFTTSSEAREDVNSLAGFPQLHELSLEYVLLRWPQATPTNAQAGILPASVEGINLHGLAEELNDILELVVAQASNGLCPGLKRIAFNIPSGDNDATLGNLRRRFQDLGISCLSRRNWPVYS
ncbi:hypothetical protein NUW58_g2416 [Xylaria curta]|uniref:Uncharacterized protein n=1 Tax=Xylaria curta TaxID=42375 RepID=A0ACC1PI62_9PEZI|nr:hypothetical protein NUW58_g2416 [Xylaria curta]